MKSYFTTVLALLGLLEYTLSITLTNIWQSLEITNPSTLSRPQDIRTASVGWKIVAADVLPNDIFFLLMPYVFRTKFSGNEISLKASNNVYAKCQVYDGSFNSEISYLKCIMNSSVDDDKSLIATGTIEFDFVFNAGGSSSNSDILSANRFMSGENKIIFNNMDSTVNFQPGPFFTDKKTDELLYYSRSTPQDLEQVLVLSGICSTGITSGTIVFTTNDTLDCSQFNLKMTNDLNDFYLPRSYESVNVGSIFCSSDNKKLTATFNNIPQDYRVFLEGFEKYPVNSNYVKHLYAENIKCGDGTSKVDGITKIINVVDGGSSSNGKIEASSSIELSSSKQETSTQSLVATHPCNESEPSTLPPKTETETTDKTNTLTETICTQCIHSSSLEATSTTEANNTSHLTPSTTLLSNTKLTSASASSITSPLNTETKTTSMMNTLIDSICTECAHSNPSEASEQVTSTENISKTSQLSESALSSYVSSTSILSSTTCDDCFYSSIKPTSLQPSESKTTHSSSSLKLVLSDLAIENTTIVDTGFSSECLSSSILSTSVPPARRTTSTTGKKTFPPSDTFSCFDCSPTYPPTEKTTTIPPPNQNTSCYDSKVVLCTLTHNSSEIFSCVICATSSPLEVSSMIAPNKITPAGLFETTDDSYSFSNIADASIAALGTNSATGAGASPEDTTYFPSVSASASASLQFSSSYPSLLLFSSYEALSNTNQCSIAMLFLAILMLIA